MNERNFGPTPRPVNAGPGVRRIDRASPMTPKEIVLPTRLLLFATVAGSVWLYGCSGSGAPAESPAPMDDPAAQPADSVPEDSLATAVPAVEVGPDTTPPMEPPEDLPQDWASRTLRSI